MPAIFEQLKLKGVKPASFAFSFIYFSLLVLAFAFLRTLLFKTWTFYQKQYINIQLKLYQLTK